MSFVVYYLNDNAPKCVVFDDHQLSEAMAKCQSLRESGFDHVVMSSQLSGQVGSHDKGGAVADGKLPNGDKYEWSKAHRAGASRK